MLGHNNHQCREYVVYLQLRPQCDDMAFRQFLGRSLKMEVLG